MSSTDPTPLSETGEREQAAVEAVVPIIDEIAAIAADGKLDERDCLADAKHIVSEVREALDKPAGGEGDEFLTSPSPSASSGLTTRATDAAPPAVWVMRPDGSEPWDVTDHEPTAAKSRRLGWDVREVPPASLSGEQSREGVCERIASTIGGATWDEPRFGPVNMDELVDYVLHRAEQAGWRPEAVERELASEREKRGRLLRVVRGVAEVTAGLGAVEPLRRYLASLDAGEPFAVPIDKPIDTQTHVGSDQANANAEPVQVDDDRPERDLTDVIQGAIEISSHRGSRPLARSIVRALQHAGLAPPGVPDGGRLTTDALRGGDPGLLDAVVLAIDWDDDAEVMASKMLTAAADYLDQDAPSGGRDREAQIRLVDEEIGDWAATHSLDFGLTPEHGRDLAAAVVDALAGTGVPETAGGEGAGAPAPERDGRTPGAAPLAGTSAQPLPPEPSAEDGERPDPSFVVSTDYFEGQPEELPEVEDITAMVKHGLGDEVAFTVTVEPLLETLAAYRVDASSTGLCSDRIEALGDGPPLNCELRAGHDGDHQAGRTRWGTISPPSDAGLLAVLRDLPLDVVAKIDRRAWEIRAAQPGKVLGYDETRSYITATAEALSEHHEVEGGVAEADCFVARLERKIARLRRLTGEEKD